MMNRVNFEGSLSNRNNCSAWRLAALLGWGLREPGWALRPHDIENAGNACKRLEG